MEARYGRGSDGIGKCIGCNETGRRRVGLEVDDGGGCAEEYACFV